MPVDQLPPQRAPQKPRDAKLVQYHDYIDQQVESTRRVVKLVDLATSCVLFLAGVMAFLLIAAVLENWVIPGGFSMPERAVLFALLVAGTVYFAYRRFWPLVIGRVNPVYAAHAIEKAGPTLKNSLVNLLLFRQKRTEISDAVFQTLEEQAAQRLSRVPIDAAVDRSLLIRFGYVLIAIVAIAAAYKVLSPKDPIIAARRVLMPWAEIVPASRVSILNIKPGVATVPRGDFLDVSADVHGIGDDETVVLRYSTADGQAVDKSMPMKLSGGSHTFQVRLPSEQASAAEMGLSQDLSYRIEAGDAHTLDYVVKVVEAPSILVERIEYDYPDYTGYVDHEVGQVGDIRAIEGTRITLHARSNGPIQEAHVDFDADGRRDLVMKANETDATASFILTMQEDHTSPQHRSYVLRFANREGQANRNPVKHSIDVEPDFGPEATLVAPQEKSLDVRLDDIIAIDVDAHDPDFGLAGVRLRASIGGRSVMDEPLLTGKVKHFTGRYQFTPGKHGLHAGDVVDYWVTADDIRTPKPNSIDSEKHQFRIVSPNPQQPPPDRVAKRDPPQRGNKGEGDPQKGEDPPQDGDGAKDGKQGDNKQQGKQQQGKGNGQGQPNNGTEQNAEQGEQNAEQNDQGGKQDQSQNGDEAQADAPQRGNDSEKGSQQNGGGGAQAQSDQARDSQQTKNDKQTGAGAAGGESSKVAQPDGARPDGNSSGQQSQGGGEKNGTPQNGGQTGGQRDNTAQQSPPNGEQSPVSSDGDNDAEAFQRIQDHLKRSGEMKDGESSQSKNNEASSDGKRSAQPEAGKQGNKATGSQGDKSNAQGEKKPADQGASGKQADKQQGAKGGDAGQKQTGEKQPGEQQQGKNSNGQPGESDKDKSKGTGAETKGGERQQKEQPGEQADGNKSPGGEQTSTKGDSGSGEEQDSQGAPNSKPDTKPTEKRDQPSTDKQQTNKQEPAAGGRGKTESDSQGEEGGDRTGGGEEGGGQKAPRDGTGSSGQNKSADDGAGQSTEKGAGQDSSNAGTDAVAKDKTGQPGSDTQGQGSKTQDGEGNKSGGGQKDPSSRDAERSANADPQDQSAQAKKDGQGEGKDAEKGREGDGETGKPGDQKDGQSNSSKPNGDAQSKQNKSGDPSTEDGKQQRPGENSAQQSKQAGNEQPNSPKQDPSKQNGDDKPGQPGQSGKSAANDGNELSNNVGAPTGGGGLNGTTAGPPPPAESLAAGADEANLEYARKQTDLVLNNLNDQLNKKKVDKNLLKQLGWSEDDLRKFVERWNSRKEAAERSDKPDDTAKRELDEALRSLGLRPGTLKQADVKDDKMRDLREGYRGPVPLEYQERLRAYNQGVSRAQQDGE